MSSVLIIGKLQEDSSDWTIAEMSKRENVFI